MLTSFAMANVKVAVRVRPLSKKEEDSESSFILDVNENVLSIINLKVEGPATEGDRHRQRVRHFTFDFCYFSADKSRPDYASQELVYQDLGTEILDASFAGYNACLFAYGQTGSGKTYTMMGYKEEVGLIPRICDGLCSRVDDFAEDVTCQIEVSYLEIYNERVRDLLAPEDLSQYTLKVREHPKDGPYVQDLSKHLVGDHNSVRELIEQGNINRTTAATHMHDASSRSHAIFTINFTQATLKDNMPSEVVSKINLVDLAGSERADPNYSKGRLTEGANINKSLVTLGNCISALGSSEIMKASNSLSAASMESLAMAEDNYTASGLPRKPGYIPYRNSVLTWLLKDSLGGNSKTIMISTVSPASTYFNETMSTLRYARRAKHIVNKPMVNEDQNVRLIRELRAEIDSLKALLSCASLSSSQASLVQDRNINEILQENEQKVDRLTEAWVEKWREAASIMQECNVGIRRENVGVIVESDLPHLLGMDDDLLSTGIILYHLKEGITTIGREDADEEQDIILYGPGIEKKHCSIQNNGGTVTLCPCEGALCAVNGLDVNQTTQLTQGAVVLFGKTNMYRFNHPAEAAKLRERRATRKNSITLKVPSSALNEEARQRSLSFSFTRDGNLIEEQDHLNSSGCPYANLALSPIMMYNSGLELERQHKIEVEKLDETRKRLAELQEKQRLAEEAHHEREEKMRRIYQSHQDMIERQRRTLERLRSEHAQAKEDAEEELRQMKAMLLEEKTKGEQKLKKELETLKDELTKKAMTSAIDACVLPKAVAMDTETSQHLMELDVDRKRVTQLELLYRQSQKAAAAELQEKERSMERERDVESEAIACAETKLADIEKITFPWQRLSSRNSLESLVEEMGSYSGESCCSNLDRVSPIGGRSDSDSNSGSLPNGASDKINELSNEHVLNSGGSKVKDRRNNSPVKNSQRNKKQNSEQHPERKVRTSVRNKIISETNNRNKKKPAKDMPHKLEVSDHVVKREDARKISPGRLKSSLHDRSPSPPKRVSPNIRKNINRSETTGAKSESLQSKAKVFEPPTDSKTGKQNSVFSRLYKQQAPKYQYLKKKEHPLYGRDWIPPPDRSHEYHHSQRRRALSPANKTPSPVRAKQFESPERGTPTLNGRPTPKLNGTPKISGKTPPSSRSVPSSRASSNSPKTPRNKHSTRSSPSPEPRNIHRDQDSRSLQSWNKNPIHHDTSNKAAVSGRPSVNPANKDHSPKKQGELIKPTRKSRQRQRIVVSPPKRVNVEYVKPKITKPKQKAPLNMTPRKKEHSESFYVPMKDKVQRPVAKDTNPENRGDYNQTERQPAIGCSKSMEDVTIGHGLPSPTLDENDEQDFMEEQKIIASEDSSVVDDFPDSLDEDEELYGDPDATSYTEPFSYDNSDSKYLTGESVRLATINGSESDISCDSLDDEDKTLPLEQTNVTRTPPVFKSKENNPFDSSVFENDLKDGFEDITKGINDKLIYTSPVEKIKDNAVNLEEISVNFVNHDDRKRKPSLEGSFKLEPSGGSESDDEATNEHAPPAKKSRRRQKKSRNHEMTCPSSDSESEDTFGGNFNCLAQVQIEIRDENDAVHVPKDNSMSDSSSASVKISDSGENSDLDGSLNLSGLGHLSDSFNCDLLVSKDGLSSEEMPPLTDDKPAENSNNQKKDNDDHEKTTSIQTHESIMNDNLVQEKQDEGTHEDQYTEDSDSDSSSEDSMEGGDYYVSAGVQVNRPLADIKEEEQSSVDGDTNDSSQSTDTYSSPFSSADEESIDENQTYNVCKEKEVKPQGEQYSDTNDSESSISDDEDSNINDSSSEETLQDVCHLSDSKNTAESYKPDKHFDVGDVDQEPNIQTFSLPPSEQDGMSEILQNDSKDSQAQPEKGIVDKYLPGNQSENSLELENEDFINNKLDSDKENEGSSIESESLADEKCSEKPEELDLDTTSSDGDIPNSLCDDSRDGITKNWSQSSMCDDSHTSNSAPDVESINVAENETSDIDFEKTTDTPNLHKSVLQVGIQNSSTECESADELPCTEHRLVGQNYAIANAQLKMIALLLGNKSTIYDSDESNSPDRIESPRRVPTSPKTFENDGGKEISDMDEGITRSTSGNVTETVIQADTVKADRLPQSLALISTFDSSQSPVISHVVPVDHHMGDIVNASDMKDCTVPDTEKEQHDKEFCKSNQEFNEWREKEEILRAKTDGTRFPPEGNVDNIYSESVSNVSKLTMVESETQTEEQRIIHGHSQLLPTSVDQMQIPEKDHWKSICADYEPRCCSGTQTESPEKAVEVKSTDMVNASTEMLDDMGSGTSIEIQTDVVQEECQDEISNPVSDNISTSSGSNFEYTASTNHIANDGHLMVSVATMKTSDDVNNQKGCGSITNLEMNDEDLQSNVPQQHSKSTCDVATSPDYMHPSNDTIFDPAKEHGTYGDEHKLEGNKLKDAETQCEDNSVIISNSPKMLQIIDEPNAFVQHKMSNEDNNNKGCETNDIGTQAEEPNDSAFDILECNSQQMMFTQDKGNSEKIPLDVKAIAVSTQTDDDWKRSVICQTDLYEQSSRDKLCDTQEVLKISRNSMGIQTDDCQEDKQSIEACGDRKLPSADSSDDLDSQAPTYSDSGIQVYIADDIKYFISEGTSCHTLDGYISNDELSSLVDQGIQTEPILLDVNTEVNSLQNIQDEPTHITLEEDINANELEDKSGHHPCVDSTISEVESTEREMDSEQSPVMSEDVCLENYDLKFLERIKEMKDKAQHVASRARIFTSKLRLSNMNDSAESLDHHSDDMLQDQDDECFGNSTDNSLEAEEGISISSNAENSEIDHTAFKEDDNQATKRSELKSIKLNTEAAISKQIVYTQTPELSLKDMENPLENTLAGDDDDENILMSDAMSVKTRKTIMSQKEPSENSEIDQSSYGEDDGDRKDIMTSELRLIKMKSQAIMSQRIACTPAPEFAKEEPLDEALGTDYFTEEMQKTQDIPSENLDTDDSTEQGTDAVDFARFKLMLCEQYVQQKMVLSEVKSFWQQLKDEEEKEEKVKDPILDENLLPPEVQTLPNDSQKVNFNQKDAINDQDMDNCQMDLHKRPTETIIYHVDEEILTDNICKVDDNMIQPYLYTGNTDDSNIDSNTGKPENDENTNETMKGFEEDIDPATTSLSKMFSLSKSICSRNEEIDSPAKHYAVDSQSDLNPVNAQDLSCDSIDANKVVLHTLKDGLQQLPTIDPLPESNVWNSGETNSDDLYIELLPSEQYVWSKNITNKTIPDRQSPFDLDEPVNAERISSTEIIRPYLYDKIQENEDHLQNELVCGKPGQEEETSAKAGYNYRLKDGAYYTSSYSPRTRFLGVVDKQVVNLPTYGVNFDLDENDEDLRALRKSHEDVERILEETSSPDSDLEDSAVEPELVALMEEIEKDHISVELAKRRLDPPSLTEDQLNNHALKVPVNYKSASNSQRIPLISSDSRKGFDEAELEGQCLDPQDMRINVKPLSPVRPDWLTESALENGSYKTSGNPYLQVNKAHSSSGKYAVEMIEPLQIDRLNSLAIINQETSDTLKVTERSSIQMNYWQSSSYNSSPYQSGSSTPKLTIESSDVNHSLGSLTVGNIQAIGVLPTKFLTKSSIPLEVATDVEILSDIQDEIPTPNRDVSGKQKQSRFLEEEEEVRTEVQTEVQLEDRSLNSIMSAGPGDISDVLSDNESLSNNKTIGYSSPHSQLQLPMDSSTQTDVPSDTHSPLLQDECTEVDQALNSSDSDHFHISIASPGSRLDRHDTSVELMEAKMMHGIGETDAWLRFLESDNSLNEWMWFKNPGYLENQYKSIGQKQKENLGRPHTSNGHYSSSLGVPETNHLRSYSASVRREHSPVGRSRQPSRQLEYLQKLRQDVVKATSQTETTSENSGIDELLAEYQKTREQSQVEISKAKEKLKQQTKKEKQRLKDEMKYLRDIENQTTEARVRAEDHIRDERKRIFLEERQLLRVKDWRHRRTSSEQDVDFAIMNLRKDVDSTRYSDRHNGHGYPSRLNRTWHGTSEASNTPDSSIRYNQPLPNHYVSAVHRQSFSPDRNSVASYASSGRSCSPPSTDRSHTRSSLSFGSDHYAGSLVSDVKSSSPEVSHRNSLDYHNSSFSTDDELSPRYSYELSRFSGSIHRDEISANSLKNAKINMMADPMLVEARYKESLERIKRYEKSRNCFHGHHQSDRNYQRGRSREHTRSHDGTMHQPDQPSLVSYTPHRRSHTLDEQILQARQGIQQVADPNHNYRNYPVRVGHTYREYPLQIPPVITTGDSDWEY